MTKSELQAEQATTGDPANISLVRGFSFQKRRKMGCFGLWHICCYPSVGMPMIDALFNQSNYVATKKMLDATVLRHEAIASNLANIETPNYKRVDVAPNFSADLKVALAGKDVDRMASMQPSLAVDSTAVAANRDGNSVELENELMQLNQNTLAHGLETQLISGTLLKMRLAITGKA